MVRISPLVCFYCLFLASAASECGGQENCVGEKDAAVLLQGPIRMHDQGSASSQTSNLGELDQEEDQDSAGLLQAALEIVDLAGTSPVGAFQQQGLKQTSKASEVANQHGEMTAVGNESQKAMAQKHRTKVIDCNEPVLSQNSQKDLSGCAGAAWHDGSPSRQWCEGEAPHGTEPWYPECCFWDTVDKGCKPKGPDCSVPAVSRYAHHGVNATGCPSATWSSGGPSKQWCEGTGLPTDSTPDPWYPACCRWSNGVCKPKATEACTVAVVSRYAHNGVTATGCASATWSTGSPSKKWCEGTVSDVDPWYPKCCNWDSANGICKAKEDACSDKTTVEDCDPTRAETPCTWTGSKCRVGCRTLQSKGTCQNEDHCKWQFSHYGMASEWLCMGYYQELFVGGDNTAHWKVNGVDTPRARFGGRRVMRPEYMTTQNYNGTAWKACGGDVDCWTGYSAESLRVRLSDAAYTKAALEITIKCTHDEKILIQIQDPNGFPANDGIWNPTDSTCCRAGLGWNSQHQCCGRAHQCAETDETWNTNAQLAMYYNLIEVTPAWDQTCHHGYKEHRLTARPADEFPILRLEVSRLHAGEAILQANVVFDKATVSFDNCMDKKANHAQCLEQLERSDPSSLLRSNHQMQVDCIENCANVNVPTTECPQNCIDWLVCLDSDTEELITLVNEAFGQALLLVQEHSQSRQNRIDSDCTSGNGVCINPPQLDIESFDCACAEELKTATLDRIRGALCEHPQICCAWKANAQCPTVLLDTNMSLIQTTDSEKKESDQVTSLDESLSGKRACR